MSQMPSLLLPQAAFGMGHELDAGGAAATMAAAGGYLVTAELSGLVLPIGAHAPARSRRAQRTLFMPWAVVYICTNSAEFCRIAPSAAYP